VVVGQKKAPVSVNVEVIDKELIEANKVENTIAACLICAGGGGGFHIPGIGTFGVAGVACKTGSQELEYTYDVYNGKWAVSLWDGRVGEQIGHFDQTFTNRKVLVSFIKKTKCK
jgi:hypothetical protein